MNQKAEYVYLYDYEQANFYMKEIRCYGVGKHHKTGDMFFVFDKNDTRRLYKAWCNRGK